MRGIAFFNIIIGTIILILIMIILLSTTINNIETLMIIITGVFGTIYCYSTGMAFQDAADRIQTLEKRLDIKEGK